MYFCAKTFQFRFMLYNTSSKKNRWFYFISDGKLRFQVFCNDWFILKESTMVSWVHLYTHNELLAQLLTRSRTNPFIDMQVRYSLKSATRCHCVIISILDISQCFLKLKTARLLVSNTDNTTRDWDLINLVLSLRPCCACVCRQVGKKKSSE